MAQIKKRLDKTVRAFMLEEIERDIEKCCLKTNGRLNHSGSVEFPELLLEAARTGTAKTLAVAMKNRRCMPVYETKVKDDKVSLSRVTDQDYDAFCEQVFDAFYLRGKCLQAKYKGLERIVLRDDCVECEYKRDTLLSALRREHEVDKLIELEDSEKRRFMVEVKD